MQKETLLEELDTTQVQSTADTNREEGEGEEIEVYDPSQDDMAKWLALFTNPSYALTNTEVSISARILSRMQLRAIHDPALCPAMAVSIYRGKHALMYNPEWLKKASFTEVAATLVHEAYHIMLRDIPRFMRRMSMFPPEEKQGAHRLLNIALDAANNALISDRMPHMKHGGTGYWVFPKELELPDRQASGFYFDALLARHRPDDGGAAARQSALDGIIDMIADKLEEANSHDWLKDPGSENQDLSNLTAEEIDALAAQLDEEAKRKTISVMKDHQKSRGRLPAHMQQLLDEILAESVIPWTDFLRNIVAAHITQDRSRTSRYFSKNRYILAAEDDEGKIVPLNMPMPMYPGSLVEKTFTIMWALDTSGSMSTKDIMEGLGELQALIRIDPNVHVIVVQCDTHISDVSILSPEESLEKYIREVGRSSSGGTDFDPPFALAKSLSDSTVKVRLPNEAETRAMLSEYKSIDLFVYHTDGYSDAPPVELEPQCPTIWCLTEGGRTPTSYRGDRLFGTVIAR